mmetsp:Transcript_31038/g.46072  ORF Transcript_31038/g.46072 Transcript_31038/m.46072 type:complete len:407 (-) Transcript_31038:150-1370(-)|eukprot:CAMPEP_0194053034 /NCGR_PEP_ID=MMETSP0009_2-20130614/48015_1 /TAXON_ID=210454 /ORGANISM="Grammatophora oceanica, Strain CCMP 410" /LENGTH=406 /DNA_ID=CAMNT_0038700909 /DNA_START=64 /DNA_END=1284 /DNA_ORIENTATION=+
MAPVQCHYEVLGVERDADASTIKKAHRKLALKYHPDKNQDDESAAESFRIVQQAYECLSDPAERKWYNEHRDAILKGWSGAGDGAMDMDILFDVVPYMHPSCYQGYGDGEDGFFATYQMVFTKIFEGEQEGWVGEGNIDNMPLHDIPQDFGKGDTAWPQVSLFYKSWESFTSCLAFGWADKWDLKEADNRRVRRAMEDENKKARRAAKRERNDDVQALIQFLKRRDPRVKAHREEVERLKAEKQLLQKEETKKKKEERAKAREVWREQAELEQVRAEEEDRLAGRIRLDDLDDYDFVGGKKGRKGKKKKNRGMTSEPETTEPTNETTNGADVVDDVSAAVTDEGDGPTAVEAEDSSFSEESSDEEPDVWRCQCCRKDFKSEGQMENHMKSKKHKTSFAKWQAKQQG